MAGIFKAYDVRGIYPDQLDERMAYRIGRSFPSVLRPSPAPHPERVVVGHDMRPSSIPLEAELVRGLTEAGMDVVRIGLCTTPTNYFAVGHLQAAGGVQVTASHNPAAYNGLKFSRDQAQPVSGDAGIPRIERLATGELPTVAETTGTVSDRDLQAAYRDHLLSQLSEPRDERLAVVVDAANGMGSLYGPVLEAAGLDLVPLYFELDGSFPNHEANPLKLENLEVLCRTVVEEGAHFGVSFDGDADRAVFVDELGTPIGADLTTALIAGRKLQEAPGGVIVYDIRSSRSVPEHIEAHGGVPVRERVGHSFIKATLRERSGLFGGELAGHYYFRENFYSDSAILAVFEMVNALRQHGGTLSELMAPLRTYCKSPEINFEVEDKAAAMQELRERYRDGELDTIDGIRIDFEDWWFNVRPSNTEPLLRLVLEADTEELLAEKTEELVELLGTPV